MIWHKEIQGEMPIQLSRAAIFNETLLKEWQERFMTVKHQTKAKFIPKQTYHHNIEYTHGRNTFWVFAVFYFGISSPLSISSSSLTLRNTFSFTAVKQFGLFVVYVYIQCVLCVVCAAQCNTKHCLISNIIWRFFLTALCYEFTLLSVNWKRMSVELSKVYFGTICLPNGAK